MSNRMPLLVAAAVLIVFLGVGGYLIFGHQQRPVQSRTFHLVVTGKTGSPDHMLAYQGDTITLTVSTDRKEEIHLHGYDKHFEADRGKPVTITFVADRTGPFDIEIEATSQQVSTLEVDPR